MSAAPVAPADGLVPTGEVEVFDAREIVGWVAARPDTRPVQVALHVNGLRVASTWSQVPSGHEMSTDSRADFRIPLSDIWKYCRRSDRLTVEVGGHRLPIAGSGRDRVPESDGSRTLRDLQRRFDEGFVFSRSGRLQLSKKLDSAWQSAVLSLYEQVSDVVRSRHGHDAFAIYGTLLGMVREGGFIGHDNDFDVAYISRHHGGRAVAAEIRDIAFSLVDAGFDVECRRTALHIHDRRDPRVRLDLFHLYFDQHGDLAFPYGIAGSSAYTRSDWHGLRDHRIARHDLKVPIQAEALVEYIYGESWRTPLPGFQWERARTSWRKDGWIPHDIEDAVYWSNLYAHQAFVGPSSFCEFVLSRPDLPRTVIDVGCGDGRDSLEFARAGRDVCGVDRSQIAVRRAREQAEEAALGPRTSFAAADIADADALREIVTRVRETSGGGAILLYLRSVVQAIAPKAEQVLLNVIAEVGHVDDVVAAEFPIAADGTAANRGAPHYRRFRDGSAFSTAIRERSGFAVEYEELLTSPVSRHDEDPVVFRMLARRF